MNFISHKPFVVGELHVSSRLGLQCQIPDKENYNWWSRATIVKNPLSPGQIINNACTNIAVISIF